MTITDAAELLAIDAAARRLSPLTLDFYRTRTKVITKIVGDKRIDLVTTADCRVVLARCSEGTVLQTFGFMRRLFRFLVAEEVLDRGGLG